MPSLLTITALVLTQLGGAAALWALFADRARGRRRCPRCWYDVGGVPTLTCPECGRTARSERRLFATRRRYGRAAAGVALVAAGAGVWIWDQPRPNGWWSLLPTPVLLMAVEPDGTGRGMDEIGDRIKAIAASHASGWLNDRAFRRWIDRGLASGEEAARAHAASAIVALRSPKEAAPRLRMALNDRSGFSRFNSMWVVRQRPEFAASCTDLLLTIASSDPTPHHRICAVDTLSALKLAPEAAVPVIAALFRSDPDSVVRRRAASALGGYGPDAAAAETELYVAVVDRDAAVRLMAIGTIPKVARNRSAAVAALRIGVRDTNDLVRTEAALSLGLLGRDAAPALPDLRTLAAGDSPDVGRAAREAIESIEAEMEAEGPR